MNSDAAAGDDEEPVGDVDAGRDAAGDGPDHESGGDHAEVDDRLVLQPRAVGEGERDVARDDSRRAAPFCTGIATTMPSTTRITAITLASRSLM